MPRFHRAGLFALAILTVSGCQPLDVPKSHALLQRPQMSEDSVALEVFFVRFPRGQRDVNGKLWDQIDEQHFAPTLRESLATNGFRIGTVGRQIPLALSELLELKGKPAPGGVSGESSFDRPDAEPTVVRRLLQLRADHRTEIVCSEIYEELPVLTSLANGASGKTVSGKTYPRAQGILALKAHEERDGRVKVEVLPEVQYGDARQRYIGGQGSLRLEVGRSKQAFDELAATALLTPGHMIVLTSIPERSGSLGDYFFRHESEGKPEQKLIVIRVSQTQHDDLFEPHEASPASESAHP
jgi:hypothetical protein